MRTIRPLLISILIAMTIVRQPAVQTSSQGASAQFFPETGFTVREPFLSFWQTRGGLEIFGYPITNDFPDGQITGHRVQYFQRARMEWHPENPEPWQVQLGLLGDELDQRQPPILESQIPLANSPDRRYYPETGHTLSYDFLSYFDNHGGIDIFGYPISEVMYEGNYLVQWFQRARMELHLEYPEDSGLRMQLTRLGETYLRMRPVIVPPESAAPVFTDVHSPSEVHISASLKLATAGVGDEQTVYVLVQDERGQPVAGAGAKVTLQFPDQSQQQFTLPPTSKLGATQVSFDLAPATPGQLIIVDATATYAYLWNTTETSFWVWW